MDIKNANTDRKAGAAVDHMQQVGILRIVVILAFTGIAMRLEHQPIEKRRARFQAIDIAACFRRRRQIGKMAVIGAE